MRSLKTLIAALQRPFVGDLNGVTRSGLRRVAKRQNFQELAVTLLSPIRTVF
jgi:hypothetical protein